MKPDMPCSSRSRRASSARLAIERERKMHGYRDIRAPHVVRRRFLALAVFAAALLALGGASATNATQQPVGPPDTYVAAWDAIGSQAFTAAGLTPAEGHVIFAYVAIAVYDSVMAIEGGYEPFAVDVDGRSTRRPRQPSRPRRTVFSPTTCRLRHPRSSIRRTRRRWPPFRTVRRRRTASAVGESVAQLLIAKRSGDGFRAPVTYTPPNPPIPGVWIPTATTPPIGTYLGLMQPFSLDSADQFRPGGPPALSSKKWAKEYNEVKEIGSSTSTTRTPEQTLAARFWAEPPVQQARGSLRKLVLDRQLDISDAARLMAMVSVTYADALIACFDAKYHYAFWRPITAIRAGHTDGNEATVGDPSVVDAARGHAEPPRVPERTFVRHAGRRARRREVPRHAGDRLHRPELDGLGRPSLPACQGSGVRGLERPHLGRYPLPLSSRGRRRDRQEDRPPGARAPLQAVERLDRRNMKEEGPHAGLPPRLGRLLARHAAFDRDGWRGGDLRLFGVVACRLRGRSGFGLRQLEIGSGDPGLVAFGPTCKDVRVVGRDLASEPTTPHADLQGF